MWTTAAMQALGPTPETHQRRSASGLCTLVNNGVAPSSGYAQQRAGARIQQHLEPWQEADEEGNVPPSEALIPKAHLQNTQIINDSMKSI